VAKERAIRPRVPFLHLAEKEKVERERERAGILKALFLMQVPLPVQVTPVGKVKEKAECRKAAIPVLMAKGKAEEGDIVTVLVSSYLCPVVTVN